MQSKDIYSGERPQSRGPLGDDPALALERAWADMQRRGRRIAILYGAGFFLATLLVIALAFVYQDRMRQASLRAEESALESPWSSSPSIPLDPRSLLIASEWASHRTSHPPPVDVPINANAIKEAALHMALAEQAVRREKFDEAEREYGETLKIFPRAQGIHWMIGELKRRQGDFAGAAAAYRTEVQEGGNVPPAILNDLGVAEIQLGQLELAEEHLRRATYAREPYLPAFFNLGLAYLQQKKLQKAAESFQVFVEAQPSNHVAALVYAKVLMDLERWDEAAEVLEAALAQQPTSPDISFRLAEALAHGDDKKRALGALYYACRQVEAKHAMARLAKPAFDSLRNERAFQSLLKALTDALPPELPASAPPQPTPP